MAPRSTHATLECEIDSEQDCLSFTNKTVMSTSPGSSIDSVEERQRTNATLESMMLDFYSDDGDAEYFPAEGDSQDDDDDEDDDEDLDPDFIEDDDFVDDDDDGVYVDVEQDDDSQDEDGEHADDGHVIDLSVLLQAAARGSMANRNANASRTALSLNGIGIQGLRQLLRTGRVQTQWLSGATDGDDDDDDDDETPYYGGANRHGARSRMSEFWDPITKPVPQGQELLFGGEFGRPDQRPPGQPKSAFAPSSNLSERLNERKTALRRLEKHHLSDYIPNTNGTEVARYPSRCYCGQYSEDSSFFYTCTQDFQVHMYDTTASPYKKLHRYNDAHTMRGYYGPRGGSHLTSLKSIKTIQGRAGSWTITDANLSPDNQWMIYSSITPYVHLVPTKQEVESSGRYHNDKQVMLDFSDHGNDDAGIWSIRFSGDSREIVAGAHFGDIYVYDIEARRRVLKVEGHADDVNGVAFADTGSSNVLISGSDDSFVKVWDRRSLSGGKPAGVLPGHTEGITYVAPKGDGRYCISNGKDQSVKLWDLRSMVSSQDFDRMPRKDYGLRQWDYRNMYYKKPRFQAHPQDCSVMTYRGHAVLKTLIRCHFSPSATTAQKYIYSGSADGRIHIWSLDGRVVQVLDRSKVVPLTRPGSLEVEDPSAPVLSADQYDSIGQERDANERARSSRQRYSIWGSAMPDVCTVRDVSWHSSEPALMSTACDGPDGQSGSIAKHEWKGFGKNGLSLEDAIERSIAEAAQ